MHFSVLCFVLWNHWLLCVTTLSFSSPSIGRVAKTVFSMCVETLGLMLISPVALPIPPTHTFIIVCHSV